MFKNTKSSLSRGAKSRIVILTAVLAILSSVLIYRLFTLQIVNGEDYLTNFALSIKKERVSLPGDSDHRRSRGYCSR